MEERYNLAIDRMKAIIEEKTVAEPYREYFQHVARFILKLDELKRNVESGKQKEMSEEELQEEMKDLYADELEANYEKSYANPAYAVLVLGGELGSFLSAVYTEIRGSISYVQEQRMEYVVIGAELLIEIYNKFEEEKQPQLESLKEIFYWYASDYCDVFAADRIKDQIDPVHSVNITELLFLCEGCTCHTGFLLIFIKQILECNGSQSLAFSLDLYMLFCFDCLMKSV